MSAPERFTLAGVTWVREPAEDQSGSALSGRELAYRMSEPCDESCHHPMHAFKNPGRRAHLEWFTADEAARAVRADVSALAEALWHQDNADMPLVWRQMAWADMEGTDDVERVGYELRAEAVVRERHAATNHQGGDHAVPL